MKRIPQEKGIKLTVQQQPSMSSKQMEQIMLLKTQLKQLKHKNQYIENQIKNISTSNAGKKHVNNGLRQTFKKLVEDIDVLNKQHILKVEENLKQQDGPVSDLIKDNGFGVSPFALMKLPSFRYQKKSETDICMGCYQQLQHNSKCKSLPGCNHVFHGQCIDQYLLVSKQCPACGQIVQI